MSLVRELASIKDVVDKVIGDIKELSICEDKKKDVDVKSVFVEEDEIENGFPKYPCPTKKDELEFIRLFNIEKIIQRSRRWYSARMSMISASDWATAIGACKKYGTVRDIILKKCGKGKKFTGNIFTEWGVKYEDVAVRLYECRNNTKVYDFGLIEHPKYNYLGASPDGITRKGIMLEIKCPFRRIINGTVPHQYWCQMQAQMEVCDLSVCDFLECKILEYDIPEDYFEDTAVKSASDICPYDTNCKTLQDKWERGEIWNLTRDGMEKGVVLTFYAMEDDKEAREYVHSELGLSKSEVEKWVKEEKDKRSLKTLLKVSYYRFRKISCVRVSRDKEWFREVLPKLTETWNLVMKHKKEGCDSLLKESKRKKTTPARKQSSAMARNLQLEKDESIDIFFEEL